MTRHEENQLAASTNSELSITIQMPCKTDERKHESLFVTFTTEFEFEVDPGHPIIKGEINRIVGEDDLASAFARLLELGDLATDPEILDRPDSAYWRRISAASCGPPTRGFTGRRAQAWTTCAG